jgi:Protein of unknown function (DUF2975)
MTTDGGNTTNFRRPSRALPLLSFILAVVLTYQVIVAGFLIWAALHGTLKLSGGQNSGEPLSVLAASVYQVSLSFGLWVLFMLVRDVRRGQPFAAQHPARLRLVAWGFLVFAVLAWLSPLVHVLPGGVVSIGGSMKFKPAPELLIALCLFALAEVFRHGFALKQETDLTV